MTSKRQARKCRGHCSDGRPCPNWAMNGQRVCSVHGGRSPQAKGAARRRLVEQGAAAELVRLDVEPLGNPLEQLALLAGQAVAWKDGLAARVNALTSLRYESADGAEQLRAEVLLWERALDRCEKFCTSMARLDIDDRLAKISQEQGRVIVSFIIAALARFGIDFHDDTSHTIVMGLFDRLTGGDEESITAEAQLVKAPAGPELSYVCGHGMHERCMAYVPNKYSPNPPPWPNRCPCPCHEPHE